MAKYPLEQVSMIKQKRLEEAEKLLREKREALVEEKEKLEKAKKHRDQVKTRRDEKLHKHLEEMDKGTTSDKIEMGEKFIKEVLQEELKVEEKKVKDQTEAVKEAEKALEQAREDHAKKSQDVEKLRIHRKEWEIAVKKEEEHAREIESDELGSSMFTRRKKQE